MLLRDEKNNRKMLGAYISQHISYYLTLFSLYNNKSKTSILENILANWRIKTEQITPVGTIINELRQRVQRQWYVEKTQGKSFDVFKKQYTKYLQRKHLIQSDIDKILNINEKE